MKVKCFPESLLRALFLKGINIALYDRHASQPFKVTINYKLFD